MSRRSSRQPTVPSRSAALPPPRFGWPTWVVVAFAAAFPVMFLAVALLRLRFPFELEWMEGSMVENMDRIRHGLPLYVAPSLEFTPFIYPPLYFWVSAAVAAVVGGGFLPLRLTSILASLACLGLIVAIVGRGARSRMPAVLAACLFAASYREGGAWLDVGRVDSLSLALTLAGIWVLRRGLVAREPEADKDLDDAVATRENPTAGLAAGLAGGVLFALAALTKQSAVFVAGAVMVGLMIGDRTRFLGFIAGLGAAFGGVTLALDAASQRWYRYYVFVLPRNHPIIGQLLRGFWIQDLLGPMGLALTIGTAHFFSGVERRKVMAFDLLTIAGLILTGYTTRVRVGSFDNVVLPAYLGVALAFGWGLNALVEAGEGVSPLAWVRGERLVAVLCVAQFGLLLYKPWEQVPKARDIAAGQQIVESLRRVPGEVWVPSHPYLARMAGKHGHAHQLAMVDVMRPGQTREYHLLMDSLRTALREHRYAAVVLDGEGWFKDETVPYYELQARMYSDKEPELFWPVTGFHTRPDFVWVPKPAGSPETPAAASTP